MDRYLRNNSNVTVTPSSLSHEKPGLNSKIKMPVLTRRNILLSSSHHSAHEPMEVAEVLHAAMPGIFRSLPGNDVHSGYKNKDRTQSLSSRSQQFNEEVKHTISINRW